MSGDLVGLLTHEVLIAFDEGILVACGVAIADLGSARVGVAKPTLRNTPPAPRMQESGQPTKVCPRAAPLPPDHEAQEPMVQNQQLRLRRDDLCSGGQLAFPPASRSLD